MGIKINRTNTTLNEEKSKSLDELLKTEITLFGSNFGNKKKEQFYTELGILLNAGVRLNHSLGLITSTQKKSKNKQIFLSISKHLESGKDLSSIFKEDSRFTIYEEYCVAIGEETGTLEKVVTSLASYYLAKNEQKRAIVNALTYPAIILVTALLTVLFMLQFVVPMFQEIFLQNNVALPVITSLVIDVSQLIGNYWFIVLVISCLLIIAIRFSSRNDQFKYKYQKLLLYLPLIGSFLHISKMAQFTQAITLLSEARVPILRSLALTKKMITFLPLQSILEEVEKDLMNGSELSASLSKHSFFDEKMLVLLKVAEETNNTALVFKKLNTMYSSELSHKSKVLTTILEPLIILVVGALVAIILISMFLPMFELGNVL